MNKFVILSIIASAIGFVSGCTTNPITGKTELMLLSEDQDIEIGKSYAPEIEKQMGGKIPDEALQNYVNAVGQKIARVSHKQRFKYEFSALTDESVNAFALPGGYIFITKGMLKSLQTEAQLAGILAHEVAHVVARDVANAMSKQIGIDLLLSALTSEETSQTLVTVAQLGTQIIALKFSRQDEVEADIGGLDYMIAAGYNPYGLVETMEMLAAQNNERPVEFLSTHPPPENRSAYLKQAIISRQFNLANSIIGKEQYTNAVLARLR
jgi:predicted Zn-dependent protease